jgi:hypothetical protein
MHRGIVATTIKGAFKVYLFPSMRARTTFAAMAEGWSDLVTEARQEVAARRQFQSPTEREVGPAVATSTRTIPSENPKRSSPQPDTLTGPATTIEAPAASTERDEATAPPQPATPVRPEPNRAQPVGPEAPTSPTLVETSDSTVEVRPNPAISPVHATAGVIGHLPPEVRHQLMGNGPIRA